MQPAPWRRPSWGWRARAAPLLALLAITLVVVILQPGTAHAHAFLERSDPSANDVVPEAPVEVRLWFTETIEPSATRAQLFDASGQQIATAPSRLGTDPRQLVLPLPQGLAAGTYTVQWRNVSAEDGHPETGYVPFTIGNRSNVVAITPPKLTRFQTAPTWLDALGRWLGLLGVTGALGALTCWLWVLRPSLASVPDERYQRLQQRVYALALWSIGVAAIGSVVALGVQAQNSGNGLSLTTVFDSVTATRFGYLWVLRMIMLLAYAAMLTTPTLWDDPPPRPVSSAALLAGALALAPFALISHAQAQQTGHAAAVANDWLHLLSASVWVGGLLALLVALIDGTRGLAGDARRRLYALAIPRFSTLAIVAVVLVTLTGFYSAWLQVGNLAALRVTDYGRVLIIKLVVMLALVGLGALNQFVIGRRLRSQAVWGRYFGRAIAAEALLGVGVLLAVGLLTSLPTARQDVTANAGRSTFHLSEGEVHAVLFVAPAVVGANTYTVDVSTSQGALPSDAQVLLRVARVGDITGVREVALRRASPTRYEATGSELSVTGDWSLELIVRRAGVEDWRATTPIAVAATPAVGRIPSPPPVFAGRDAGLAVHVAAAAIVTVVVGLRRNATRRGRASYAGFGLALLVISAVTLAATQTTQRGDYATVTAPRTAAAVAAGAPLFQANCAGCHGPQGLGDGPDGVLLTTPPANLTEPHVDAHTDGDILFWIENGIPARGMPGLEDELTQEQMLAIVSFVRSLRAPVTGAAGAPLAVGATQPIDACGLLQPSEVEAVVGAPVVAGTLDNAEGYANCVWSSTGGTRQQAITLRLLTGTPRDTRPMPADALPVADLADSAYWLPQLGDLVVRSGAQVFDVQITASGGAAPSANMDRRLEIARALAILATTRISAIAP